MWNEPAWGKSKYCFTKNSLDKALKIQLGWVISSSDSVFYVNDFVANEKIGILLNYSDLRKFICFDRIEFGDDCLLSWQVLVMDTDFHKIYNDSGKQLNGNRQIYIGNKNWIGCRTLILKGVTTPNNCVIAANSTVTNSSIEENTILAGSPAEVIRQHIRWEKWQSCLWLHDLIGRFHQLTIGHNTVSLCKAQLTLWSSRNSRLPGLWRLLGSSFFITEHPV